MSELFTFNDCIDSFNDCINNWDVSNVTNMGGMFDGASAYDQNMTLWCVSQFSSEPSGFSLNNSIFKRITYNQKITVLFLTLKVLMK